MYRLRDSIFRVMRVVDPTPDAVLDAAVLHRDRQEADGRQGSHETRRCACSKDGVKPYPIIMEIQPGSIVVFREANPDELDKRRGDLQGARDSGGES